MLWIRQAQIFAWVNHAPSTEKCRNVDFHGISGDVCREDLEAPPPLFCPYLCLDIRMVQVVLPLDGAQGYFPVSDIRIAGDCITTYPGRRSCRSLLTRDATLEMLFQESLSNQDRFNLIGGQNIAVRRMKRLARTNI